MPNQIISTVCVECGVSLPENRVVCSASCRAKLRNRKTPEQALLGADKIRKEDNGCWTWLGSITPKGYGRATFREWKGKHAHKAIYEFLRGPVPEGMELDHICHDPKVCKSKSNCPHRRCVNPDHVLPVTHKENTSSIRSACGGKRRVVTCVLPPSMDLRNAIIFNPEISKEDCLYLREGNLASAHLAVLIGLQAIL